MTSTEQQSSIRRVLGFIAVMYKPHYAVYGVLWVLALEGTAALVSGENWKPNSHTAVRTIVVLMVLLYLRMVDEQKDLEYDRVNNPDRPLVTGAVSAAELRVSMVLLAAACVGASLWLSIGSAAMIAATLAYGLLLWAAEASSRVVRTHIMVNLVITYPVQLVLTAYVLVSAIDTGEVRSGWRTFATALIFAGAFLQFEFARKTSKRHEPRELLYSNALGAAGSGFAIALFATLAVAADLALVQPWRFDWVPQVVAWLPILLVPVPWAGLWQFLRTPRERFSLLPAVVFVLVLYAVLILAALVLT
ncbi:hypothetical protein [Antrihabitans sp. YC2-6]|uniref:hypothetical protein n=1 Tax=Antrihabitans sp. YC2-6 TaxID=2799498 RepID=UPI0018F5700E|nr:hypothetical protein [Antrihabitans sp. YC2-6]MBJ8345382.1 hypothetical protein [Antrihabitans sp. YC2-6]